MIKAVFLALALTQQPDRAQLQYDSAYFAWQHGHYPEALSRLRAVLNGAGASRFLEPAALLTGELFVTTEIAPPNRYVINITTAPPKWSADGRLFVFETTAPERQIHVHRVSGESVARINGFGSALSFDGSRVAFLRVAGRDTAVVERDLGTGTETTIPAGGVQRGALFYDQANQLFMIVPGATTQVVRISGTEQAVPIVVATAQRVIATLSNGRALLALGPNTFGVFDGGARQLRGYDGSAVSVSANGAYITFLTRENNENVINLLHADSARPIMVKRTAANVTNPVATPDGRRVVFQMMPREDWELYVVDVSGQNERRITREIQHDHTPRFLTSDLVLGVMGENRHRRSYLYDLGTGTRTRLFHNNLIRTVSMEYAWAASPDGSRIVIVADRDGDTISPERGVYVMDLGRKVSTADVLARLERMAAAERELRERGRAMFSPIAARVRALVAQADVSRVYAYEKALFEFDSKFITQPGNQKAIEYIANTLRSFGYEPELQWFEPRPGIRSANVIATLRGTRDPNLVYAVSSHFDSVERGPGADDDTSGAAALLEAARILAGSPQPATIKFLWFTGEEAGLLGSRYFVRQAVASQMQIVGALNNDMVGYANDERLDNTIRYSNAGLRDLQHAAAFLFTNLITYDSKYYQSTDAHAYYDAYGDIVAGIGSYPILGNPHYHQPHDVLETINHQLVTEVAKTTAATLMLMASSPARLKTVSVNGTEVTWSKAPESNVSAYLIAYGPSANRQLRVGNVTRAILPGLKPGDQVWVKAVNTAGLAGWDWIRTTAN